MIVMSALMGWMHAAVGERGVLGLYAGLFLPYFYLVSRVRNGDVGFLTVCIPALCCRALFLPCEPLLSDDLYRYVWEGRVFLAGWNPFVVAPSSELLSGLRDAAIWPNINHPDVPSIYPPLAQYLFAVNALAGGGTTLMKALFLVMEMGCVFAVALATRHDARADRLSLLAVYGLNPLVFVETAWSGHLDAVAWGLLCVAMVVWRNTSRAALWSGLCLGMSISTKFIGVMALPLMLLSPRRDQAPAEAVVHRTMFCCVVLLVVSASYLPFRDAGFGVFSGFGTYTALWRSNDGVFDVLASSEEWLIQAARPDAKTDENYLRFERWESFFIEMGWTETWREREVAAVTYAYQDIAQWAAKFIGLLLVLAALAWAVFVLRDPWEGFAFVFFVLLCVAPTVHPWYVAWLVPFAARRRWMWSVHLVFSAVVLAAYWAWWSERVLGVWEIPRWVTGLEYGVVFLACLVAWIRSTPDSSLEGNAGRGDQ
jgi:alpha-1,6-mannosyltransferase